MLVSMVDTNFPSYDTKLLRSALKVEILLILILQSREISEGNKICTSSSSFLLEVKHRLRLMNDLKLAVSC